VDYLDILMDLYVTDPNLLSIDEMMELEEAGYILSDVATNEFYAIRLMEETDINDD
jgi:hypothetical protein